MEYTPPKPFSDKERERRWKATRKLMEEHGIDGLVVSACGGGRDFRGAVRYLSDYFASGRFAFLVFPLEGNPIGISVAGWVKDNRVPSGIGLVSADYAPYVIQAVKDLKLDDKTVGIVGHNYCFPSSVYEPLKTLPNVTIEYADELLEEVRWKKSAEEVRAIEESIKSVGNAFERFCEAAKPGRTVRQVWGEAVSGAVAAGCEWNAIVLITGVSYLPVAGPWDQTMWNHRIKKGDSLVFYPEFAGPMGYWVHYGRTISVGTEPSKELRDAFDKFIEIRDVGVKLLRPGNRACDVYNAIKNAILEAGLAGTTGWEGHGMGLDTSIVPYITAEDNTVLEAGMPIAIHPMIRDRKWPGVNLADLYLVTETAPKHFNPPQEYRVV